MEETLSVLASEVEAELLENILPFWMNHCVNEAHDGFYGAVANKGEIYAGAPRASVITARVLWTFSKAYQLYPREAYQKMADIAYCDLINHFYDSVNGGIFWNITHDGMPEIDGKQAYGQAFAIYGLAQYGEAFGRREPIALAMELFACLETHFYDAKNGGYIEVLSRDWQPVCETRLHTKGEHPQKTMNTNLHVMEAYTNLYRVTKDARVKAQLRALVELTLSKIVNHSTYGFNMFFDAEWNSLSSSNSFGHNIEGSWLLPEAADVLGDAQLSKRVREISVKMADAVLAAGVDMEDNGILGDTDNGVLRSRAKGWWPQAEGIIGFLNAYMLTKDQKYLTCSLRIWDYVKRVFCDHENGEWLYGSWRDVNRYPKKWRYFQCKAGRWKCPYHNSRMCMEVVERAKLCGVR